MTTFLVPVDGSPAEFRALEIACDDARRVGALVSAIYVIVVPRTHPVDADLPAEVERAETILSRAEAIAQERGTAFRCGIFQSRDIGSVIADEAEAQQAEAVVIGLHDHRPYGRFELGREAHYILANVQCEVRIVRPAVSIPTVSIPAVATPAGPPAAETAAETDDRKPKRPKG